MNHAEMELFVRMVPLQILLDKELVPVMVALSIGLVNNFGI
jgi:hypothetical protein